jgi:polysaccharide lyase-like protein
MGRLGDNHRVSAAGIAMLTCLAWGLSAVQAKTVPASDRSQVTARAAVPPAIGPVSSKKPKRPPVLGRIDFVADSESGDFTQWGCPLGGDDAWPICSIYDATLGNTERGRASGNRRVQIDSVRVRQGRYSTRFEVQQGDGAHVFQDDPGTDFSLINWFKDDEGQPLGKTYFWGFSVLFDESWPNYFGYAFADWHQKRVSGCTGPAPINLDAGKGFRLIVRGGACNHWLQSSFGFDERGYKGMTQAWDGNNQAPASGLLRRGQWYDFVLGVRWAVNRSGWVELWMAPAGRPLKKVVPRRHVPTAYADGRGIYLTSGIYRSRRTAVPGILWQDGWRRGTTFAKVSGTRGCCPRSGP